MLIHLLVLWKPFLGFDLRTDKFPVILLLTISTWQSIDNEYWHGPGGLRSLDFRLSLLRLRRQALYPSWATSPFVLLNTANPLQKGNKIFTYKLFKTSSVFFIKTWKRAFTSIRFIPHSFFQCFANTFFSKNNLVMIFSKTILKKNH